MNVVILVDELNKLEELSRKYLKNIVCIEGGFKGVYKSHSAFVFYSDLTVGCSCLKIEKFFLNESIDVIVNVGKCYRLKHSKVPIGSVVMVNSASCKSEDFEFKFLDKDVQTVALISAEELNLKIPVVSCFSVSNTSNCNEITSEDFECFDSVSFWLYDMASRYSKKSICFYLMLEPSYFDIHHYLIEKNCFNYDSAFRLALEFSLRWK